MIRVRIGQEERELDSAGENWINQQIARRKSEGEEVCVRVIIKKGNLDLQLATPTCGGGGGGRPPRPEEREILNLWNESHLDESDFAAGNVVAFLKRLKNLC